MAASTATTRRHGMRAAAPLAVAVAAFGVPFGVLARAAGFDPLAAIAFSATTFAGSAQFAAVALLESGGGVGAAVVAAALLNSRYVPMGVSVAPAMTGPPLRRLLRAQLVVDESWAVAQTGDGVDAGRLVGAGVVLYLSWVGGTAVGALAAGVVADPHVLGLDAAFPALFLALLAPTLRRRLHPRSRPAAEPASRTRLAGRVRLRAAGVDRRAAVVAVLAAGAALGLTPLLPPGVPLVAAAGTALLGLLPARRAQGGR